MTAARFAAAAVAVVLIVGAVAVALLVYVLTAPILPAPEPMTTGTAGPIPPSGPVEPTAIPMHLRDPR